MARLTDQVLVRIGSWVVQGGAHAGIQSANQTELDKQLQGGVDRGSRDAGQLMSDGGPDLFDSAVAAASAQLSQDDPSLGRCSQAAGVQKIDQVVNPWSGWPRGGVSGSGR